MMHRFQLSSSPEEKRLLGCHYLIELWECGKMDYDKEEFKNILEESARLCECTIVQSVFHQFNPHGISGVVVIAESHLSVHTWPEYNAIILDIFTCKLDSEDAVNKAFDFLCEKFQAKSFKMKSESRFIGGL